MAGIKSLSKTLYLGTFVHCVSLKKLDFLSAVFVDEHGKIVATNHDKSEESYQVTFSELGWKEKDVTILRTKGEKFFFPGFIDTHIHASQFANAGIFGNSTLLDWLETYTFPMESSLKDLNKARRVYTSCIARTLSNGTTTAAYYATIDLQATNLLADLCLAAGQRAFVGRVCMDSELQPEYYRDESPEIALSNTVKSIEHIKSIDPKYDIVSPIITPRFAPSCTPTLLHSLGRLAKEEDLPIQTHISENKNEIKLVNQMFPEHEHYADVYDKHDLLGPRTILAHCVHLTTEERDLIKSRNAKVSHCPASNSSITSGTAKIRWLLDASIDVGLGTDMSGGFSPSILEGVRQALLVSRHVAMAGDDATKLTIEECLYLATRGGAKVVGLGNKVGGFDVGMDWDAQLIGLKKVEATSEGLEWMELNDKVDGGPVDIFGWETMDEKIAKWVFTGDDRNTTAVWVKGRLVHKRGGAIDWA